MLSVSVLLKVLFVVAPFFIVVGWLRNSYERFDACVLSAVELFSCFVKI